jgi:hypothetical protein
MKCTGTLLRTLGIVTFIAVASLVLPLSAHAGGVHVSIGFGLPVAVIAPPPPVVVALQPVVVQPAPVVVHQPPVVIAQPRVVYTSPYYRGYRHWRHHRY